MIPAEPVEVQTAETTQSAKEPAPSAGDSMGDTAGTGTIIALGCITGTIFIIVLGLVYLLITQVFG